MNNTILNSNVIYYAIKMNGTIIGEKFANRTTAETSKARMLIENEMKGMNVPTIIEVVQVTADGQEVLFG